MPVQLEFDWDWEKWEELGLIECKEILADIRELLNRKNDTVQKKHFGRYRVNLTYNRRSAGDGDVGDGAVGIRRNKPLLHLLIVSYCICNRK